MAGWRIRALSGLLGAGVIVIGLTGSAVPTVALPQEGGQGRAVASPSSEELPIPAASVEPVAGSRPGTALTASGGSSEVAQPGGSPPGSAPGSDSSYIATLNAATSYSATPGGPPVGNLPAHDPFGLAQVLAVVSPPDSSGWLHVELPVRPNGSTGWIPAAGVGLSETPFRIAVDLEARTITVTDAGQVVLTSSVAIGSAATPTPPGDTYVWELIRPDDPNGAYGPFILGLAWFSDAYAIFNGGDAQIGIHGQDEPWSIGSAVSHGCVRLPNDVDTTLAGMVPLGTPVTIS